MASQVKGNSSNAATKNNNDQIMTPSNDIMSYKDRFQNNFQKFAASETPPPIRRNTSVPNGNSHLAFLYDKAQGITPESNNASNDYSKDNSIINRTCSKYLTDPQSAIRDQTQPKTLERAGYMNDNIIGGTNNITIEENPQSETIIKRAVPATPDFLNKSNPLSPNYTNGQQNCSANPWQTNKTPDSEAEKNWSKSPEPLTPRRVVQSPSRTPNSMDQNKKEAKSESTDDESGPRRPSFEQTRRHWVYTPKMFNNPEPQQQQPQVERKLHPGARSRPLPDYLNFRKYSVPLVSPTPKVEVQQHAVDDQSPQKQPEMRSLQKSNSEVDSSSVHQLLREGDEIGLYHQKSIRYTGRTNPSRVFQLLQSATGMEPDYMVAKPPPRRRPKKPEHEPGTPDADDIVDITYVGGNIPSRTFQCLKDVFDDKDSRDPYSSTEFLDPVVEPVRSVKVIHLRPRKSIDNGISAL